MHRPELLDHFHNPRNAGELPPPAQTVEATNPVCGDTLRLWVLWEDDRIVRAAFKARGCTASIAAGSLLTEWLAGRNRHEISSLTTSDIDTALGGMPPESKHAATLCVDAVKALLRA